MPPKHKGKIDKIVAPPFDEKTNINIWMNGVKVVAQSSAQNADVHAQEVIEADELFDSHTVENTLATAIKTAMVLSICPRIAARMEHMKDNDIVAYTARFTVMEVMMHMQEAQLDAMGGMGDRRICLQQMMREIRFDPNTENWEIMGERIAHVGDLLKTSGVTMDGPALVMIAVNKIVHTYEPHATFESVVAEVEILEPLTMANAFALLRVKIPASLRKLRGTTSAHGYPHNAFFAGAYQELEGSQQPDSQAYAAMVAKSGQAQGHAPRPAPGQMHRQQLYQVPLDAPQYNQYGQQGPQFNPYNQGGQQFNPHGQGKQQFYPHGQSGQQYNPHGQGGQQFNPHFQRGGPRYNRYQGGGQSRQYGNRSAPRQVETQSRTCVMAANFKVCGKPVSTGCACFGRHHLSWVNHCDGCCRVGVAQKKLVSEDSSGGASAMLVAVLDTAATHHFVSESGREMLGEEREVRIPVRGATGSQPASVVGTIPVLGEGQTALLLPNLGVDLLVSEPQVHQNGGRIEYSDDRESAVLLSPEGDELLHFKRDDTNLLVAQVTPELTFRFPPGLTWCEQDAGCRDWWKQEGGNGENEREWEKGEAEEWPVDVCEQHESTRKLFYSHSDFPPYTRSSFHTRPEATFLAVTMKQGEAEGAQVPSGGAQDPSGGAQDPSGGAQEPSGGAQ